MGKPGCELDSIPAATCESLLDSMPLMVALLHGPDYRVRFANRQFRESTGNHALLGRPLIEALPQLKHMLPALDRLRDAQRKGEFPQPVQLQGPAGLREGDAQLEWLLQPLHHNQADAEIALFAQAIIGTRPYPGALGLEDLDRMLELTTSLLAVLDDQCRYLRVNPAFTKLLGWTEQEMLGQPASLFIHPEDREYTAQHVQRLAEGRSTVRVQNRLLAKDGSHRWIAWSWALTSAEGKICALGRDITETKEAEARLRREAEAHAFRVRLADTLRPLEDSAEIQREAARLTGEYFHVPRVNFALVDPDGRHVVVEQEYARGVPSVIGRHSVAGFDPDDPSYERIDVVPNVQEDHRFPAGHQIAYQQLGIVALVMVRLVKRNRFKAMLTVADAQARIWTDSEVNLIEEVAERVWTAIERADAEAALRKSEERYHLMALATNDVICDWSAVTGRLEWNDAAFSTFGYTLEELGSTIESAQQHIHPEDRERVANSLGRALMSRDQQSWSGEFRFRKSDDTYLTLLSRLYIGRDASGKPERVVSSLLDLTERRRVEEALYTANVQLVESDRRKNEFLAMLAHELRNPLAAISNAVQLLTAVTSEVGQPYMSVLQRQVGMLSGIVDDLLDVSRITQGLIILKRERVNVAVVAEQALESAYPLIEGKQLKAHMKLPDRPVAVLGDPLRLEQILTNLLTNAAKYTDAGGEVTLSVEARNGWVEISVRDTGIGIAPDAQERIFTLFGQVEPGLDRAQGGLGIGLTIVKNLVELHGGKIEVHSAGSGQGAEFTVTLPRLVAEEIAEPSAAAPGASGDSAKRILIVEDSADVAETLRMLLEVAGHDVVTVNNGLRALEKADEFVPDLVLLDIGLPGMDGYEVARRLRKNPRTQNAVLAALTGYGQDSDRALTEAAGFDAHFVKPVNFKALTAFIGS